MVALLATYSCVEDNTGDNNIDLGTTTTLSFSMEDALNDANRTSLGNKKNNAYPVHWSVGDQVSVNGVTSAPLEEIRYSPNRVEFEFVGDLGGTPYKASYPAINESGKIIFAEEQSYVEGTFSEGAAPMYGESPNS